MRNMGMALAGLALIGLAGCKSNLADTTDEQLVQLLAGGGFFGSVESDDRPPQITRRTVECIEILSGSRAEVYKDMPAELAGMMKTDCRQFLQGRLDDPKRNTTTLELSDFESAEMMERVTSIAAKQEAALTALQEQRAAERREAEEQDRKARREKLVAELVEAQAAIADLKAELQKRLDRITPACAALVDAREKLTQKNWEHPLLLPQLDVRCVEEPLLANEKFAVLRYEEQLSQIEAQMTQEQNMRGSVPGLPALNLARIDDQIAKIEREAKEVRAAVAEP